MRLIFVAVCVLAFGFVSCDEPSGEYLPPVQEVSQEYIPPVVEEAAPAATLADDGYRYKAVKRLRFRHRRDVSELNNEYLPPTHEVSQEYLPPVQHAAPAPVVEAAPAAELAADGYRYKAVKRLRFRHRRDVSELNNEYLPPTQEVSQEYLPPVQHAAPGPVVEAAPAAELAADGYRYKTVKRLRFRHRRDVSELNNEYLPPTQEVSQEYLPPVQHAAPGPVVEAEPAHELAADGYRYKAVKRLRYRHRRDVSELNNEYLPPVQEQAVEVVQEAAPVVEAAPAHELAADGYRYKAVKRLRYRHRRDVSELNNEYLPPVQEQAIEVVQEAAPVVEAAPAHELAADGYRYKAVKRLRYRHRRDVSELNNEYLPPVQEQAVEVVQEAPVVEAAPAHELAADGYRYKAVKRLRYRHRRDVSELNNEYLPPVQEQTVELVQEAPIVEAAPAHELAADGYRYKAVKRLRYRHRRDVSELNNEYLPPVQEQAVEVVQEAAPVVEAAPAHELSADGYRYKAVKRLRYRHRRDVSELNNEYLPPVQEQVSQEYLPPVQQAAPAPVVEAAPAHTLADDGYRYKAVRRVVYRRRY